MARETITACQLSAGGFTVEVEAAVVDGDFDGGYAPPATIHCLSLLGPREATRAVWARLLRGKADCYLRIAWDGEPILRGHQARLHRQGVRGFWNKIEVPLPEATAHHLLLIGRHAIARRPDLAEGEEHLLLPDRVGEASDWLARCTRFLQPRLPFHLFEEWGTAIWEHIAGAGDARRLRAYGFAGGGAAHLVSPDLARLQAFVTAGVANGSLRVPGVARPEEGERDECQAAADGRRPALAGPRPDASRPGKSATSPYLIHDRLHN